MKTLVASVLFACIGIAPALADPPQPSTDSTVIDPVKKVEQDMGDAMVADDFDMLNRIYGDDWASVESSGKTSTKKDLMNDFRSGASKLVSYENGPMDVQVIGDIAVVHGSTAEKRLDHGKETNSEFVWMDLLKKRAGNWVVVRSAGAKVK